MTKRCSLKIHDLDLTYDEFVQKKKSLVGLKIDKYQVLQKLGEGSFGSVWKGVNNVSKQFVAIKALDLQAVENEKSTYKKNILKRLIKSEAEMMTLCSSQHVVKCFQVYQNEALKLMIIEYCADGDLENEVTCNKYFSEQDAVLVMKQILNGLAQMHRNGIIHRDLKAENILIHEGIYKIADFGLSKQLASNQSVNEVIHTKLGTIYTMAPEVLKGSKYGLQADIWSIGVIFYFMLYGKTPYEQNTYEKVLKQIQKKKIFEVRHKNSKFKLSQEAKSFIQQCLTVDSQKRLNWRNIANHKLFSKYQTEESIKSTIRKSFSMNKGSMMQLDQKQIFVRNDENKNFLITNENAQQQKVSSVTQVERKKLEKASTCSTDSPYEWVKETSLQCQITQFILQQIAEELSKLQMSLCQKRQIIQITYLMYARCFINMSFRLQDLKELEEKNIPQNLKEQIQRIYKKSHEKFREYSKKLTNKQSEFLEVVQDKLKSLMVCTVIQEKDIFLTGIEFSQNKITNLYDYTKRQEIDFTQKMITQSITLISQSKILKSRTFKYLSNYQNICMLTLQQAGKVKNIRNYIQSHFCCS